VSVTYSTIRFAPVAARPIAAWRGEALGYVLDGSIPQVILASLMEAADAGGLSAVAAIPYAEWVHWGILPLVAPSVTARGFTACAHSRPELVCGMVSAGESCHIGCPDAATSSSTSLAPEVAHWHVTTFLSNHMGGEGAVLVYDTDVSPSVIVPEFRIFDFVTLKWRRRAELVAVLGRTVVLRSDAPYELLPTTSPYAAINMCLSIESASA
jgi:hypothetical protein